MLHPKSLLISLSLILFLLGTSYSFYPLRAGNPAPDFRLENPLNQYISLSDFEGKVVCLLVGPGNDASQELRDWGYPLISHFGSSTPDFQMVLVLIVDTPFFISKEFVFDQIRDETTREHQAYSLVEWDDSTIEEDYQLTPDVPNIFVIGRDGTIYFSYAGSYNVEDYEILQQWITYAHYY